MYLLELKRKAWEMAFAFGPWRAETWPLRTIFHGDLLIQGKNGQKGILTRLKGGELCPLESSHRITTSDKKGVQCPVSIGDVSRINLSAEESSVCAPIYRLSD